MKNGTITRRMDSVLNDLENEFKSLYTIADFQREFNALKAAGNKSNRPSVLAKLFVMFDSCGIKYEKDQDATYYANLIRNSNIPDTSEIVVRMFNALFKLYREYPSPEDYMKRIVDRMTLERRKAGVDQWQEDTLRIRILKQFIKYGEYLVAAEFGGRKTIQDYVKDKIGRKPSDEDVIESIDDRVFDGLENADKGQKRPDGKYGLLKVADDLATGKFRTGGATKKQLYLFAMVYGMTYYSENSDQIFIPESDIEKNLFRDYYTNNLMRFISDTYKDESSKSKYVNPSGQGINYKNFAEMIYLYYIAGDHTPQDKVRLSHEMIERVKGNEFKSGKPSVLPAEKGTQYFRAKFFGDPNEGDLYSEDILRLPEEEFERFICDNYDCDIYETKEGTADQKVSELQLSSEQNTAYENYKLILQDLSDLGVPLDSCNYGLSFADVAAYIEYGNEYMCDRRPDIDREQFNEFVELLKKINEFLGYTHKEARSKLDVKKERTEPLKKKIKALDVSSPSDITRTSMIVAYYYYFNAYYEDEEDEKMMNFEELFGDFKKGVDEILEKSYYQPLSGKNIFDVLVVFSSYAYLNL
jgi:hypothetical protein